MKSIKTAAGEPPFTAKDYLAAIVESSEAAIIGKDLDGTITSWNSAAEQIYGYTAEEVIGRPVSILAAPEIQDEMPNILARIRRGERVEHYETLRRRKDGQIIHVSLTVSPVRDSSGRIIGASKIARDITESKRLEQERRDLERNLALLLDASERLHESLDTREIITRTFELAQRFIAADAYAIWRSEPGTGAWSAIESAGLSESFPRHGVFAMSPTAQTPLTLYAIEDVTESDLVTPRRPAYAREGIHSLLAAPFRMGGALMATLTFYFRETRKFSLTERRIAMALVNLAATALSNAELYQEQIRLRAEAQESEQRSNFLARASVALSGSLDIESTLASVTRLGVPVFADWCIVHLLRDNGTIENVGMAHSDPQKVEQAKILWDHTPIDGSVPYGIANVIRTGCSELYSEITDELLQGVALNPERLQMLREARLSSGILVPLKARDRNVGAISFIMAESGRHYTHNDLELAEQLAIRAGLAIDNANLLATAERRRAEAQAAAEALRESNAELEQFAYVSSHDLQEPLRTVASYAQLLSQRYRGRLDPEADQFIDYVVSGAVRMSELIDALLGYSRLVRRGVPAMAPVDAGEALEICLLNLRTAIADSGATITHDPLPVVWAHETQFIQVFQNLVSNAIKYRAQRPLAIHISAVAAGSHWKFSVSDNGIGIHREYWDRIFGLFKRLHDRSIPGTGIGLATCKRIIEQHGGQIWVDSVPGQGTTFYFTLASVPEKTV